MTGKNVEPTILHTPAGLAWTYGPTCGRTYPDRLHMPANRRMR